MDGSCVDMSYITVIFSLIHLIQPEVDEKKILFHRLIHSCSDI